MKRWLSEPLLHFLLLGGLIFFVYLQLNPGAMKGNELRVSEGQQRNLLTTFSRTWQRPPTQAEYDRLIQDWIREEIAYRQALEMGLESNDTIIRRRLRQKLEMLAEEVVSLSEPSDAVLQANLDDHQQSYQLEPRFSLRQIYFSPDRRGADVDKDAADTLAALRNDPNLDPAQLGDPLPLPDSVRLERAGTLASQFGSVFVTDLDPASMGRWDGPVRSGFGLHLVRIDEYEPGRALTLDEAREAVFRDWSLKTQRDTLDGLYERFSDQYEIIVEPLDMGTQAAGAQNPDPQGSQSPRTEPSGP